MLREEGLATAQKARRVLEIGPEGEGDGLFRRARRFGEHDRLGRVTPRASHERRAFRARPHDRVVAGRDDVSIGEKEKVCDPGEALERLLVFGAERQSAHVGARHHERDGKDVVHPAASLGLARKAVEDEGVKRRIGEHDPDRLESVGNACKRRHVFPRPSLQ